MENAWWCLSLWPHGDALTLICESDGFKRTHVFTIVHLAHLNYDKLATSVNWQYLAYFSNIVDALACLNTRCLVIITMRDIALWEIAVWIWIPAQIDRILCDNLFPVGVYEVSRMFNNGYSEVVHRWQSYTCHIWSSPLVTQFVSSRGARRCGINSRRHTGPVALWQHTQKHTEPWRHWGIPLTQL